jgi:hypothetical protein
MRTPLLTMAAIGFLVLTGCGGGGEAAPKADLATWKESASRALAGEVARYAVYVDAGEAWSSAAKAGCKGGDSGCEKKLPEFAPWNTAAAAWGDYVDEAFGALAATAPNDEAKELAGEARDALHERASKAVEIVVDGKKDEFDRLEKRAREAGGALMEYACPGGRDCPGFE